MAISEIQVSKEVRIPHERTTLTAMLVNIFVSPSEVFDEIRVEPIRPAAWIVPVVMVSLGSLLLLVATTPSDQMSAAAGPATMGAKNWVFVSVVIVLVSALVGTIWSALVLWGIGRMCLKVAVPLLKTLEVAGLAGMILVLGTVVTALLILATGNPLARPSLSLLAGGANPGNALRAAYDVFNVFYLWSIAVLAIGLSRLTGVSLKECAFWAFGYWLVVRISLVLLG